MCNRYSNISRMRENKMAENDELAPLTRCTVPVSYVVPAQDDGLMKLQTLVFIIPLFVKTEVRLHVVGLKYIMLYYIHFSIYLNIITQLHIIMTTGAWVLFP